MKALHTAVRRLGQIEVQANELRARRLSRHRSQSPSGTETAAISPGGRLPATRRDDAPLITSVIRDRYGLREGPVRLPGEHLGDTTISRFPARVLVIGAVVAYVLLVAELGGHLTGHSPASAAQPVAQSSAQPTQAGQLRMGPISSGVPSVDDALRGFLAGDVDAAFSQLTVQQVACGALPSGGTPFLPCVAPEARATVHELIQSTCGPKWVTADAARADLETALAATPGLYAVDRIGSAYMAVLSWPDALDQSLVLTISAAGVTSYGTACGVPAEPAPGHALDFVTAPGR